MSGTFFQRAMRFSVAGLALVAATACGGGGSDGGTEGAEPINQAMVRQKILKLEATLAAQGKLIESIQDEQGRRIAEVEENRQRVAEELNALKVELRMPATPIGPRVPSIPDEAPASAARASQTAKMAVGVPGDSGAAGGGPRSFFLTMFGILVLLAFAFLLYKFLFRWQDYEPDPQPEDDEEFETGDGTVRMSPDVRRQSGTPPPADEAEKEER